MCTSELTATKPRSDASRTVRSLHCRHPNRGARATESGVDSSHVRIGMMISAFTRRWAKLSPDDLVLNTGGRASVGLAIVHSTVWVGAAVSGAASAAASDHQDSSKSSAVAEARSRCTARRGAPNRRPAVVIDGEVVSCTSFVPADGHPTHPNPPRFSIVRFATLTSTGSVAKHGSSAYCYAWPTMKLSTSCPLKRNKGG